MIKIKLRRFDTVVELRLPTEWFVVRVNLWRLGLDRDPAKYTLEDLNSGYRKSRESGSVLENVAGRSTRY